MAGFFQNLSIKRHINGLKEADLDRELEKKAEEYASFDSEVHELLEKENALEQFHKERMDELNVELNKLLESIDRDDESIRKRISDIDERNKEYVRRYKEDAEELEEKMNALVEQRKEFLSSRIEKDNLAFEKEKEKLDKQLSKLEESRQKLINRHDKEIKKIEDETLKLKQELDDQINAVETEYGEEERSRHKAVEDLNIRKEKTVSDSKEALDRLEEEALKAFNNMKDGFEKTIETKREELADFYKKIESLSDYRTFLKGKIQDRKVALDREYDAAAGYNQQKKQLAINAVDVLRDELLSKENAISEAVEAAKAAYEEKKAELSELTALFKKAEKSVIDDNGEKLAGLDRRLKEQYSDLVGHLDLEYENGKKAAQSEVEGLKLTLEAKKEDLAKKEAELAENLESLRNQSAKDLAEKNSALEELRTKLSNMTDNFDYQIKTLNDDILALQRKSEAELKARNAAHEEEYNARKKEYEDNIASIEKDIADAGSNINVLNGDIASAEADINALEEAWPLRKAELEKTAEEELARIASSNASVTAQIAETEGKIEALNKENEEKLASLEEEKAEIIKKHDLDMEELKNRFVKEEEEANRIFNEECEKAGNSHNDRLAELKKNLENTLNSLKEEGEKLEAQKNEKEAEIKDRVSSLKADYEFRIDNIKESENALLARMDEAKLNHDKAMEELGRQKTSFADEFAGRLEEVRKNFEDSLSSLDSESKNKLNEVTGVLEACKNELSAVKVRYDGVKDNLARTRERLEGEEKELKQLSENRKNEAMGNYQIALDSYNRANEKSSQAIDDAGKRLSDKQNEIIALKASLKETIDAIRDERASLRDSLKASLDGKLNAYIKECEDKEKELSLQYDGEVARKQDELNLKRNEVEGVLNEIKAIRENTGNELEGRYQEELAKANDLQRQYETLSSQLEMKMVELLKSVEDARTRAEVELEEVKKANSESYEARVNDYNALIKQQEEKSAKVREEIEGINLEIKRTQDEFELYRIEKENEFKNIKLDSENSIKEIAEKVAGLVSDEYQLKESHDAKLDSVFKQIEEAKNEYEEILRAKPASIMEVEGLYDSDIKEANENFKQRLLETEQAYKNVISELEISRNSVLSSLSKEIESLVNDRQEKLDGFEKDILSLSERYQKMIQAEVSRQNLLGKRIESLNEGEVKFEEDSNNRIGMIETALADGLEKLAKLAEGKLDSITRENEKALDEKKAETKALEDEKQDASDRLQQTLNKYEKLDESLLNMKADLIETYRGKVEEIRKAYTRALENQKLKYKDVDLMSGNIEDIFK